MPELSPLARSLKKQKSSPTAPVWDGPESDSKQGGITQSLLSRYLCCKERYRLMVIEGLKPEPQWNPRTGYGDMWHVCEEAFARDVETGRNYVTQGPPHCLKDFCIALCRQYPMQQEQIDHWYNVCKVQFPLYVDYWSKHKDVLTRTPLLQEQTFHVPYKLPSGRIVYLRGKWDAVDLIGKGKSAGVYLQENKTKSEINESQLKRQLTFDLQTMLYLVALREWQALDDYGDPIRFPKAVESPILGVRFNVIRRPLSGGKGTIRQHKPTKSNPQGESKEEFYQRVAEYIREEPDSYFMRWKCEVSQADIQRFKDEFLHPCLENLCDDYEWWAECRKMKLDQFDYGLRAMMFSKHTPRHLRLPYGIYNPVLEGGEAELDNYIQTGSTVGLQRGAKLFSELE